MRELGDAYSRSTSDIRPGVKGGGGGVVGRKGKTFLGEGGSTIPYPFVQHF